MAHRTLRFVGCFRRIVGTGGHTQKNDSSQSHNGCDDRDAIQTLPHVILPIRNLGALKKTIPVQCSQ
jgi:hypothetical protein